MRCDMRSAYAYHRLCLQLLQSQAPGRWVLKAPGHMFALDALVAAYPDVRLVVTHRDPVRTVPSSASLSTTARPETLSDAADLSRYFGRAWLDILGTMVDKMIDFRDRNPSVSVYDLHYRDLARDPVAAVRDLYAHFGEALTDTAAAAMRDHLARHPRERYGAHRYEPEDFGLDAGAIRARFAAYTRRFDVREDA
jgi:hypothetical protein